MAQMPPRQKLPSEAKRRAAATKPRSPAERPDAPVRRARARANEAAMTGASGRRRLDAAEVAEIFARFEAREPEPKGELVAVNAFTLLVAVVLSAQATDAGVNKATKELFRLADTPQKMLALGEDKIRDLIKTIGFFNVKARNVVKLSEALVETHGGVVPDDREALETLPGVGRKTANVVLNIAFGQPTMAVDTHIFRVSNRTGLAPGKDPLAVEMALLEVVPERYLLNAHHWLILHGRYVCKALKPDCPACLIDDICLYEPKTGMPER
jgi:endonuclease III